MESVLLFFVDGVGIGDENENNPLHVLDDLYPLANTRNSPFEPRDGAELIVTDACLGIDGRPQSASGQTTIYTGVNAPELLGYHKHGFPNAALRELITEHSIFKQIKNDRLGSSIFANTYTPGFFESKPRWKSATTCSVEAADMRFCRLPDLIGRRSVFHDFTNRKLIEMGFDVPEFAPEEAGNILVELLEDHRFVLYEHFITDKIGHDQDWNKASDHLPKLARMLRSVIELADLSRHTVVLTSDHGNLEDLSIRNHTRNDVATVVWGKHKEVFLNGVDSLADITPCIIDALKR